MWRDSVRCLTTNPVAMCSSPAMDIYAVHCWLISPNKLNLFSWLLVIYVINKVHDCMAPTGLPYEIIVEKNI